MQPNSQLAKIKAATGLDFCFHDLRRTFATHAQAQGMDHELIRRALNHSSGGGVTETLPEADDFYSYVDHPMPRNHKKLLVTALSNRGGLNKKRWPRNWQKNPDISPIINQWTYPEFRDALVSAFPWFLDFEGATNYALQVQWLESQAIIQAMRSVLDQGAGCLSVHESLIVPISSKELAKTAMINAFQDVAGIIPILAEKA